MEEAEPHRNRRIVGEVMDEEVQLCDRCGVDTEGRTSQVIAADTGEIKRQLCHKCADKEEVERYEASGELNSRLLMMANLEREPAGALLRIKQSYERLLERVKEFEQRVWLAGLWKVVYESSSGLSMKHEGSEMLLLASAGRAMVTMQVGDHDLTLITADGDPEKQGSRMGIQGVHATEEKAGEILALFTAAWERGERPKGDGNVSLL